MASPFYSCLNYYYYYNYYDSFPSNLTFNPAENLWGLHLKYSKTLIASYHLHCCHHLAQIISVTNISVYSSSLPLTEQQIDSLKMSDYVTPLIKTPECLAISLAFVYPWLHHILLSPSWLCSSPIGLPSAPRAGVPPGIQISDSVHFQSEAHLKRVFQFLCPFRPVNSSYHL